MQKIKIWFCDFWPKFEKEKNFFIDILENHFEIELNKKHPDYLFYSNFGYDFLKYKCVKIFFNGENVFPNFNLCDYAISCHEINMNNRYLQFPIFLLKNNYIIKMKERKQLTYNDLTSKNKFCNFVYDNKNADPFRKIFFEELSKYKKVDSAGKFLNNIGYVTQNKIQLQKQYKFTIAFENETYPDYCTEKIMDAFSSRTIPIYWGDKKIGKIFNEKAFINCLGTENMNTVIKRIKEIDNNEQLWLKMINQSIFNEKNFLNKKIKELEEFLIRIVIDNRKQLPKSLEAKRINHITRSGSRIIHFKHKLHRIRKIN